MSREAKSVITGISIVCVYNDADVLQDCLTRSISNYSGGIDVDFIPVDNTGHDFTTAGAALNHGARNARFDSVFYAHQDVYLHSIDRLAAVAEMLKDEGWGLLGANGFTADGGSVGRIRDRVLLIGASLPAPADVDSVDEVIFTVRRDVVLDHPFTEDPQLAWHAYAVEYGLRMRRLGKRVGAVDMAVTHNSLTINLDKLDVAHAHVGELYTDLQPIQTTCGIIGPASHRWKELALVRRHGWRARRLRYSIQAERARRRINVPVTFADICHEVDLLPYSIDRPLHLLNLDDRGGFASYCPTPLTLTRRDSPVHMRAFTGLTGLLTEVGQHPRDSRLLITDVSLDDLTEIAKLNHRNWVVGLQDGVLWVLGGFTLDELPAQWSRKKASPFGIGNVA